MAEILLVHLDRNNFKICVWPGGSVCNSYFCWKWTRLSEFKSCTNLFAFHVVLILYSQCIFPLPCSSLSFLFFFWLVMSPYIHGKWDDPICNTTSLTWHYIESCHACSIKMTLLFYDTKIYCYHCFYKRETQIYLSPLDRNFNSWQVKRTNTDLDISSLSTKSASNKAAWFNCDSHFSNFSFWPQVQLQLTVSQKYILF